MFMTETISKLDKLFDELNGHYFGGELPTPVITVQTTPRAYGHCSRDKIWTAENDARYEINLAAEYLTRPIENTAATLVHEMVHLWCRLKDIKETSQSGRYHNNLFRVEAEKRGLSISYDSTVGWSLTQPAEDLKQVLRELGYTEGFKMARGLPGRRKTAPAGSAPEGGEIETAPKVRNKQKKYTCPCCGQFVKSAQELNIMCGVCKEPMTAED